ncbi:MAG: hypothetical protein P8M65_01755 [Roseibacillus sp.]|nr:hypothetical protein [Roseibacillus sp.]
MDPIESWVDVSELRRMADALLIRPEHPEGSRADPHAGPFGAQFEGFEAEPVVGNGGTLGAVAGQGRGASKARDALASARELARKGGLLEGSDKRTRELRSGGLEEKPLSPSPPKEKAEEVLPRERAGNSVPERLAPFGGWLHDALGSRSYFLLERSGNVVLDEAKSEKLHHLARTLAQAAFTAKRQAGTAAVGNLHIKVEQGSVLEVIPVNTREGLFILGVLLAKPLLPRQVETAARGLQQVVDSSSF